MIRRREENKTAAQKTAVPTVYHKKKDQEARLMSPVATPSGIPVIRPNPTIKDGVIAVSGFFAREKRTINSSSPKNNRGLTRRLVSRSGTGRKRFPVAGLMVIKFTVSSTISVETKEIINPGRKIARLLPIQISLGLSGVASSEEMFPLTFSLTMGRLAKAQMKVIRTNSGKK